MLEALFIAAFVQARVFYGRGLFPHTKATFIAVMAVCVGAYAGSWLVALMAIPCLMLLLKPDAGHRYMAFNPADVREYDKNPWMCWLVDKIMNTHGGDLMTKKELRLWGAAYAAIQGLAIIPLLCLTGNWWGIAIGLLGALRGACWYVVKSVPHNETYGGMASDALEGLLFAFLVVAAYGQT